MASVYEQLRLAIVEQFTEAGLTVPVTLGRSELAKKSASTRIVLVPAGSQFRQETEGNNHFDAGSFARQKYTREVDIDAFIFVAKSSTDDVALEALESLCDSLAIAAFRAGACVPARFEIPTEEERAAFATASCALGVLSLSLSVRVNDQILPLTIVEGVTNGISAELPGGTEVVLTIGFGPTAFDSAFEPGAFA